MKRILILSASVGAGHMRAAQAVELAAREMLPDAHVQNVDVLALSNAAFRRIYGKAYLDLVNKAPHVLGYFYDLVDKPPKIKQADRLLRVWQKANLGDLVDLLTNEHWDLVINTHFLPAEIIASMRKRRKLSVPHVTVTTDFETHRLWVNDPCERYFTATEEGARYLASFGVPLERVRVTGIPIHTAFASMPSRSESIKWHGLSGKLPIVLQLAGGFGVGPIAKVHQSLLSIETPIELVCVCGKNTACQEELKALDVPSRHKRHIIGFTNVIHQLMAAADLVVTKPGGLTSSECLAAGAPMLIINPIPGQESRNADYLLEAGAAIKANNLATISYKAQHVLADPSRLKQMRTYALSAGRPRAAYDIVTEAVRCLLSA